MSVILTEDEKMIVELAADFAKQAIAPIADEMEAAGRIPKAVIAQMAELGFMGINIPEAYGGIGMGEEVKALVIEEIAKADASVAELLSVHTLSSDIINRHGTDRKNIWPGPAAARWALSR